MFVLMNKYVKKGKIEMKLKFNCVEKRIGNSIKSFLQLNKFQCSPFEYLVCIK